jgi:heterotetrameric sarcosine oxidase gamma subunit
MPTASGPGGRVRRSGVRPRALQQVQAWPETAATLPRGITELTGAETPAVGKASAAAGLTVTAVAPGRYLIASDDADLPQRFQAALPSSDGAASDISHGRVILRLEGQAAADVLATSVALDLHPSAFPPGKVAQTMIHHIDVVIHRRGEKDFDLWVLRSYAEALAEWLLDQGLPFGIAFARRQ